MLMLAEPLSWSSFDLDLFELLKSRIPTQQNDIVRAFSRFPGLFELWSWNAAQRSLTVRFEFTCLPCQSRNLA